MPSSVGAAHRPQTCVVHGDPNPGNIRMTADRVAMIDWDESHVDVPDLDLVLPHNAAGLDDDAYDIAAQAPAAWEAAVCWDPTTIRSQAARRSSSGLSHAHPVLTWNTCAARRKASPANPRPLRWAGVLWSTGGW